MVLFCVQHCIGRTEDALFIHHGAQLVQLGVQNIQSLIICNFFCILTSHLCILQVSAYVRADKYCISNISHVF